MKSYDGAHNSIFFLEELPSKLEIMIRLYSIWVIDFMTSNRSYLEYKIFPRIAQVYGKYVIKETK